ncbi:MAG: S1 family peptidase [Polyangiaceae bacterium]
MKRHVSAALAVVLLGCGGQPTTDIASLGQSSTRVQMLDASVAASSHDFVITMADMVDPTGLECDAVLLAPNLLVTARHCVGSVDDTDLSSTCSAGGAISKTPAVKGDFAAANFSFYADGLLEKSFAVHAAQIIDDDANVLCGHDIAFIVLDGPIDGVATASLGTTADTFAIGDTLSVAGFGATDSSGSGLDSKTLLERDDMNVVAIGPAAVQGPTAKDPLMTGEFATSIGFCNGDSGGPALDTNGNVIGIVSRVVHNCTTGPDIFTSTAAHFDIATKAYAAAGVPFSSDPPAPDAGASAAPASASSTSSGCNITKTKKSDDRSWSSLSMLGALALLSRRRRTS